MDDAMAKLRLHRKLHFQRPNLPQSPPTLHHLILEEVNNS